MTAGRAGHQRGKQQKEGCVNRNRAKQREPLSTAAPSVCRKRPAAPAFSARTRFPCAWGAAGETCRETLLRKASDRRQVDGFSLQGCFSALQRRKHHVPVREAHGRNMIAEAACSRSSLSEKAGAAGLFRQDTFPLRLRRGRGNAQGNLAAQGFRTRRTCRRVRIVFGGLRPSKLPMGFFDGPPLRM